MDEMQNITDDNRDASADETIKGCFDLRNPKSFFLFTGAGSGKTRSLVSALEYINSTIGKTLKSTGRKVAVITYTNAARDEINRRSKYNSLFEISTIHSFAWNLISSHTADIKEWLKNEITSKINENEQKQAASRRTDTKAYIDRAKKIINYRERLNFLNSVKKFIYNPDGINIDKNSLDHAEVIKITSELLSNNEVLQKILVDKYPILLIDESQDTKKELMDVFLKLQCRFKNCFTLGLLGDTMQRIYLDGKEDLQSVIPDSWEKPVKIMNHRSQKRIVDLCNDIRRDIDDIQQQSRNNKQDGIVRIFITDSTTPYDTEQNICKEMSREAGDCEWLENGKVKCLTVEHKMAAHRLGFSAFYEPLNNVSSYKQGLTNGTLSATGLFTHILLPLYKAAKDDNQFEIMNIVRNNSNLYQEKSVSLSIESLNKLDNDIESIIACWKDNDPTCRELLNVVFNNDIFPLHKDLKQLIEHFPAEDDGDYNKISNLDLAINAKFSEVERYFSYVSGNANFDTHQGVKGLEFDRVMVIIDDNSAHGSTFNYNKLFGLEEKSDTDIRNECEGKETTLDRTRRLLYVTCSRAINSLAIVYYTSAKDDAYQAILDTGWFEDNEIIKL